MKFIELTVHTSSEASELVADAMWSFTPHGVTVCDANDIIALQRESTVFWDYMDDQLTAPQKDVLVKCFLEPEKAEAGINAIMKEIHARKELAGGAISFGTLEETKREIEGDDWIDVWKKHFRPIHVGKKIVVVPEWIAYEKQPHEEVILLDSNMAFGTGEHETTSMCLELLQECMHAGDTVIDVGCGSGILGIAAAKLGAKKSYLTDIDPIAVESATHNAQKN
ncbi:MAG: 50S ribosomal protein L11 methyltransferase, partial [Clostridiales bacterium]|nr:50S ribosomal protein L11 methyltransferase [Clostridiales bacterium]